MIPVNLFVLGNQTKNNMARYQCVVVWSGPLLLLLNYQMKAIKDYRNVRPYIGETYRWKSTGELSCLFGLLVHLYVGLFIEFVACDVVHAVHTSVATEKQTPLLTLFQ